MEAEPITAEQPTELKTGHIAADCYVSGNHLPPTSTIYTNVKGGAIEQQPSRNRALVPGGSPVGLNLARGH